MPFIQWTNISPSVSPGAIHRRETDAEFRREGQRQLRLLYIELRELVGYAGKSKALLAAEHNVPVPFSRPTQRNSLARLREVLRSHGRFGIESSGGVRRHGRLQR